MVDVTRRVAAESSFTLAKGSVKDNGILRTPVLLLVPARPGCGAAREVHDRKKEQQRDSPNIQLPNGRVALSLTPLCHLL